MRTFTRSSFVLGLVGLLAGQALPQPGPAIVSPPSLPGCGKPTAYQRAARTAFDSEMVKDGKECPGVTNTIDLDRCLGAALRSTERNLTGFLSALEGIVGREAVEPSQRAWRSYRSTQCDAIAAFYRKGTIAPSARARCEIDLTRSRMRDLDALFEGPLHH